ncbi:MAG: universal stress protein [Dehalococcoidia bacterium]
MQDLTARLRTILVPVDGSEASLEALSLACVAAKRNKGKVYVIYTITVHRSLPLDAQLQPEAERGEDVLSRAEAVADALDFEVQGELLQARDAGHAIVDEAIERGVDSIFMGIEYTSPFGMFQLTDTAEYVLRHAPCEVWLCRHPVRGGEGR